MDDTFCRIRKVRGFVHYHWRISGSGTDRALAGFHRSIYDCRSASHTEQFHFRVLAHHVERVEGRLDDGREQIRDAGLLKNCLVVGADRNGGTVCGGGMGVVDDGVAGGDHVDCVAGQRRHAVCRGGHRADNAPRREVDDRQPEIAAERHALKHLNPRHEISTNFQLLYFVVEPSDFCFVKLDGPPFLSLSHTHLADHSDGFLSSGKPLITQLFKRTMSGLDSVLHLFINPKCVGARRWGLRPGFDPAEHLAHHPAYQFFVNRCHLMNSFNLRDTRYVLRYRLDPRCR